MKLYILFFLSFYVSVSLAQYDHISVFPELEGEELFDALKDQFKPASVLDYGDARDTLFSKIDASDGILECVYTGFSIDLDPSEDPTTNAFNQGINTEHTYPRAKGAMEFTQGFSDMHHLFATRADVNQDRGNLPLLEVNDQEADAWYFDDEKQTAIPNSNIDAYSELKTNVAFEPRESHKGNVARAYFYFYTMYRQDALNADENFFEMHRETLCDWHSLDPVDQKEWIRNMDIAVYQDNKPNPFILDCRLARLYCNEISESCRLVNNQELADAEVSIYPNPFQDYIHIQSQSDTPIEVTVLNDLGQIINKKERVNLKPIDTSLWSPGMYYLVIQSQSNIFVEKVYKM